MGKGGEREEVGDSDLVVGGIDVPGYLIAELPN